MIGADWLVYQDIDDLIASCREGNESITDFECSVFDGRYVTGDIDDGYLSRLHNERNDANKKKTNQATRSADDSVVGLYNDIS